MGSSSNGAQLLIVHLRAARATDVARAARIIREHEAAAVNMSGDPGVMRVYRGRETPCDLAVHITLGRPAAEPAGQVGMAGVTELAEPAGLAELVDRLVVAIGAYGLVSRSSWVAVTSAPRGRELEEG